MSAPALPKDFHCPSCGSCGITDCCGLRCLFLADHKRDYEDEVEFCEKIFQELQVAQALLRDASRLASKLAFLWAAYPPKYQYGPLRTQAADLARRIDAVVPPQQTVGP